MDHLKQHKVAVEDSGDEIGPVAEGSRHMGLWFRDPGEYRWESAVRNKPYRAHPIHVRIGKSIARHSEHRLRHLDSDA